MSCKPRTVHAPVQKPGDPTSTVLQSSMKRYQRSRATLRVSRLLINLSRIGMARGRALLEQLASRAGSPGEQSPHERGAESLVQRTDRWTYSVTSSSEGI